MLGLPLPSINTLLSVPILSFLVLPSALSYGSISTYLNLIFFSIAWGSIVLSHQPSHIELFGTLATRVLFYVIPSLLFLGLDLSLPSLAVSIKAHGNKALPQKAVRRGKDPVEIAKYVAVCLGNVLLGVALQSCIEYCFIHLLYMRSALRISATLPMPFKLAKDLTLAYLIRTPLTYYIHKHLLHSPQNSATITKWHGTWQHSLSTALPLSSSYDHPAVYLIHTWLPTYLPASVLRMHMLTYLLFITLICLEEAFAWSGYNVLPSTIMLAGMARRTEAHLMSGGAGNFGPFGLMDWVHGTTIGRSDVMDDIQQEADKHNVKGKAQDATKKANNATEELINAGSDDDDADAGDGVVSRATGRVSRAMRSRQGQK